MAKNTVNPTNITGINDGLKILAESYKKIGMIQEANSLLEEQSINRNKVLAELSKEKLVDGTKEKNLYDNLLKQEEEYQKKLKKSNTLSEYKLSLGKEFVNQLKLGWTYLQNQDKVIKNTILNLGMSGANAKAMRTSFEGSVKAVSMLGGNIEDIGKIQTGFADETGRAQALTESMVIDIAKMAKGTGLSIEQATQLAGQFDYMGVSIESNNKNVQSIVDLSERMGVNSTKVLKNLNDNFKKMNTFTFQRGSKAMGEMAMSAEKTRVSLETALNVADAKRNLESVIELGANLQVMGGEFAKMDPFEWLYTVRNEPDKLNEKISEMTRGLYTLKKNAEGTFETFISPADVDRMRNVAKQLGISYEEMAKIGQRRMVLDKMGNTLRGLGFGDKEKGWVSAAAKLSDKTGRFEVSVGGHMVAIENLTKEQAASFVQEQKTLEERAKDAQTFNDVIINTINAMKGALLPILNVINGVLGSVRYVANWFKDLHWAASMGLLITGGLILKGAAHFLGNVLSSFGNVMTKAMPSLNIFRKGGGTTSSKGGGFASELFNKSGTIKKGAPELLTAQGGLTKAQGVKNLATGGGFALAAVGIGAGIGAAAVGISKLTEAMKGLDATGIQQLPNVILSLGAAMSPFAVALTVVAFAGANAAGPMLALGAAALMVGGAIGIAAFGIGKMAEGMSMFTEKNKGIGLEIAEISLGVLGLAAALTTFSNPITLAGGLAFAGVMATIIAASVAAGYVANSIERMGVAMKGSAVDFIAAQNAIESISKAKVNSGGMLSELTTLLKTPLKVEFADKEVNLRTNITLELDGERFFNKTLNVTAINTKFVGIAKGITGNK